MTIITGFVASGRFDRQVPYWRHPPCLVRLDRPQRYFLGTPQWLAVPGIHGLGLCLDIRFLLEDAWALFIMICWQLETCFEDANICKKRSNVLKTDASPLQVLTLDTRMKYRQEGAEHTSLQVFPPQVRPSSGAK